MDDYTKGQALINSIIGDGTGFRGDLDLKGLLRIDGDFEGNIRTDGRVLVGKAGRARCLINADTVVVGGIVKGDIKASGKIVLLSTCVMIGNIRAPQIIVEEGVLLHGHCTISEDSRILASAPSGEEALFSVDWGGTDNRSMNSSSGL
ncbi:MAG: polymer-forming cytoskeletal protein [Spirochaetaceae bacterium]|nr:polymer-forming cytoskeletal protein [Spirochaetaceae bacterium]